VTQEAHPNDLHLGPDGSPPLYANFPRRLNALSLDTVVLVVLSVLIFSLASVFEDVEPMRIALVILWWVVLLFYEPLLVWRLGGTVGHRAMNLRVFDNRTDRNVSLFQAVARFWVKALLGVLSFLTMNFSRRHQALQTSLPIPASASGTRPRLAQRTTPWAVLDHWKRPPNMRLKLTGALGGRIALSRQPASLSAASPPCAGGRCARSLSAIR